MIGRQRDGSGSGNESGISEPFEKSPSEVLDQMSGSRLSKYGVVKWN